ncbi:anti-sigma factor [Silvibacterium acidisoli]|uniref:anti-sigma factor n=1 Tax=Acidobacteriaceae bacterium ZG23-2 TaxID=2883246 RepID=UPI00406CB62D
MNDTPHISQEDLTLYAMQALTPEESRPVQAHLDVCAECRAEYASILAEVALIGLSAEQQVMPGGARQRLLARAANTPQEISAAAPAPMAPAAPLSARSHATTPATTGSRFGWVGWLVAVATLAVAAYLGNHNLQMQQQLNQDRGEIAQLSAQAQRAQELMEALTSPEAQQVTLTESKQSAQPNGHAVYLKKSGTLVFVASHLHPIAADKTYELWLIPADGKAPIPAGLFRPDTRGSGSVVLPNLPTGVAAKAFGVTIEDAQGANTPTLPIVLAG